MQRDAEPAEMVPAGHGSHCEAPAYGANSMGTHGAQVVDAAVVANRPGAQVTQTALPGGLFLPAGQAAHASVPLLLKRPASHAMHMSAPGPDL